MRTSILAGLLAAALPAVAANAATVTITLTEFGSRADALAAQQALLSGQTLLAYEDFESLTSYDSVCTLATCDETDTGLYDFASTVSPLSTSVGDFEAVLPLGTGGSSRDPENAAIIRSNGDENNNNQPNFGRYDADLTADVDPSTGAALENFIDSNDNTGILLSTASAGLTFNYLSFILTDYDDVGALGFAVDVSGPGLTDTPETNSVNRGNSDIFLATLFFSEEMSDVDVVMNIDRGDGFGADSFAVSAVPLPAPALMLIAGLGALGVAKRRRKTVG